MGLLDLFSTPEGRAQLYDLLFNFDGRISRAGYWRACFAWLILLLLLLFVMIVLGSLMPYLAVAVTADRVAALAELANRSEQEAPARP